jgi:hypothetical protein
MTPFDLLVELFLQHETCLPGLHIAVATYTNKTNERAAEAGEENYVWTSDEL